MNCDKLFPEDNEGPIISFLKPLNFEIVNESVKVLPISPNFDVAKVEIEIGRVDPISISNDSLIVLFENKINFDNYIQIIENSVIGSDGNGKPLLYYWDTTTKNQDECCYDYPDSSIWFMNLIAYDSNNNKTVSDGIFLMVDNSFSSPELININSITLNEDGAFIIDWERTLDEDFYSYILTKSSNFDMIEKDTIAQLFSIDNTSYIDSSINPLSIQYYEITVIDTFGYSTKSEVFSSSLDQYPLPISIDTILYNYEEMTILWDFITDTDLKEITVLISSSDSKFPDLDDKDTLFKTNSFSINSYTIQDSSNFNPTIENWFWIMSIDTFSQVTIGPGFSNKRNLSPLQSNINNINYDPIVGQFVLEWEPNLEEDFLSYILLESIAPNMENSNIIINIDNYNTTEYFIQNIDFGEVRYYQILVQDGWNQQTYSNIYEGNSSYFFNEKYNLYQTNDNLYSILNLCNDGVDKCRYLIAGSSTPNGDTRPDVWVSIVDTLGLMYINNDVNEFDTPRDSYFDLMYSYNNPGEIDQINSVIETSDNNFLINTTIGSFSSTSYDPKLIKLDASNLSVLWELNLCLVDEYIDCGTNKNYSKSLKELDNSNFILTGYTLENNSPDNLWIMKTDNNGMLLSSFHRKAEAFVDQPPPNGIYDENEIFTDLNGDGVWNGYFEDTRSYDIIQDGDDFIVIGSIEINNEKDIFISKYNNSLNLLLWEKIWSNPGNDEAYSIVKDIDGYIITGYKTNDISGDKDIVILKIQGNGENLYEIDFPLNGLQDEVANKIISTSDNSFVLIGYTTSYGNGNKDIFVVKFRESLIEWNQTYGCLFDDIGYDIKETFEGNNGGYIIGGKIYNTDSDAILIKTNHRGETNQIICDD